MQFRKKLMLTACILLPVLMISGLLIMALFSHRPEDLGLTDGQLRACPESPNCVCSCEETEDREHFIDPISVPEGLETPLERMKSLIESLPRTSVITATDNYLHAEFTTRLMRFVDDVEFHWMPEEGVLHVRSASRLGKSDLGTNRKRVEELRKLWKSTPE